MKKMIVAAQEHVANDAHILIIGMPAESHLLRRVLMAANEIGPFVLIDCSENRQLELEHVLRELDYPSLNFGADSPEQLVDELLTNLFKEAVSLNSLLLEYRNETTLEVLALPKNKASYGVSKTPLKSSFNNHSRQVIKSVRRKK